MPQTLNDLMQCDHVIRVREDGTIDDRVEGVWAPEVHIDTDEDGQITREHEQQMIRDVESEGWQLLTGWTGQYLSAHSPIMHPSEYIGGALEEHIRETPGLYAAVSVEDGTEEGVGWAVAYREENA